MWVLPAHLPGHCANCLLNKSLGQQPRQPAELLHPPSPLYVESFLLLFSLRSLKKRKLAGENCRADGWVSALNEGLVALPFGLATDSVWRTTLQQSSVVQAKLLIAANRDWQLTELKVTVVFAQLGRKRGRGRVAEGSRGWLPWAKTAPPPKPWPQTNNSERNWRGSSVVIEVFSTLWKLQKNNILIFRSSKKIHPWSVIKRNGNCLLFCVFKTIFNDF